MSETPNTTSPVNPAVAESQAVSVSEGFEAQLDAVIDKPSTLEAIVSKEQIQSMIGQLSVTEEGESLRGAMQDLKKALLSNPEACSSLLPEEIGAMVAKLRKMTGRDVELAAERMKKSSKKSAPKIDFSNKDIQQEILDDL